MDEVESGKGEIWRLNGFFIKGCLYKKGIP
jgi:hypothetical protein